MQEENKILADPYFTEEERSFIRSTFKDNPVGLKTLRKFLLPKISHEDPIGQLDDTWKELGENMQKIHPDERELKIIAHTTVMSHIDRRLQQIAIIAGTNEESAEEKQNRLHRDSSK